MLNSHPSPPNLDPVPREQVVLKGKRAGDGGKEERVSADSGTVENLQQAWCRARDRRAPFPSRNSRASSTRRRRSRPWPTRSSLRRRREARTGELLVLHPPGQIPFSFSPYALWSIASIRQGSTRAHTHTLAPNRRFGVEIHPKHLQAPFLSPSSAPPTGCSLSLPHLISRHA